MTARPILLSFVVACGGAAQSQPVALPSATATTATTPPPQPGRGPSAALLDAWPGDARGEILYADLDGLFHTKLVDGLVPPLLSTLGQAPALLDPAQVQCVRDLVSSAKEVATATHGKDTIVVVRLEKTTPSIRACADLAKVPDLKLGDDGIAVIGAPAARGDVSRLRALRLVGDERVAFHSEKGADVRIAASDERVSFHAAFDAKDEADAADTEKQLTSPPSEWLKGLSLSPDQTANVERIAKALHVKHDGAHVDVLFELREPPVDQARDVGMLAGIAIEGVRKYLLAVKEIEAIINVQSIAQAIVTDWEREPPPGTKHATKLRSFPAIPKDVPRGVKYTSKPDEWKAWDAIKFSVTQPQYYQYQVRAARDGQSADVIAHGDLDGNGKVSTFQITIRVDPKTKKLVVGSTVKTDPDE